MNSKILIAIIFTLSAKYFCAQSIYQNLIPNGDFEELKSTYLDSFPSLSEQDTRWLEYFGVNYIYSKKFLPDANVPKNGLGYQQPYKGHNYFSELAYSNDSICNSSNDHSYAQIKLWHKLRKKYYKGIMYLSLIDTNEWATSSFGMSFTQNQLLPTYFCPNNSCPYIASSPQVQRPFGNPVTDKVNWTKVEAIFKGNGEYWMTIGNFDLYQNSFALRVSNIPDTVSGCFTEGAGYYIDNVSLVEEDRAVAYFDTTKKYLCVQQGTSKVLGDTLVRPWLFYEWKDANGNVVGTNRNYTYNAAVLENTLFTLEIKDTGEYAFITKPIDTIYVSSNISGLGCTYVGIDDFLKDAEQIDFYYSNNEIRFNALHERFVGSTLVVKSIEGKTIYKTDIKRNKNKYSIPNDLQKGFYFIELCYNGDCIKRKKIASATE